MNRNFREDNHHLISQEILDYCYSFVYKFLEENSEHCYDNFRIAKTIKSSQVRRYRRQQDNGCCGFLDLVVMYRGEKYLVGCNYGH